MTSRPPQVKPALFRRVLRWGFRLGAISLVLILLPPGWFFGVALYHHYVTFPRESEAWESIRRDRLEVKLDDGWGAYRGSCHNHSHISHDSNVPFEEILAVLQRTEREFIFMSDHVVDDIADYSRQWKGLHEGVLFIRGYEMGSGFMPWGLPDETILRRSTDDEELAQQIEDAGGLLFFAHTEEERQWELPQLDGMEIYNLHADAMDETVLFYLQLVADVAVNIRQYPDLVIRRLFDRQETVIARWDALNKTRKIVGIQGTDAHQNQGYKAQYSADDTLIIADTSPQIVAEFNLNLLTRGLLRLAFGRFDAGDTLFEFQADPYERIVRYSATHILANELSEAALCASLKQGRVYIGFDMIADARGFVFFAENNGTKAVMGEELPLTEITVLRAASPHHGRFTVVRDGEITYRHVGRELEWRPNLPGNYRIEVELYIVDGWVPWIYSNPLRLTGSP